jgi:hypothetical protein
MSAPAPKRESWWRRWILKPIITQLSQGTQPRKIAQAIAFGVTLEFSTRPLIEQLALSRHAS